MPITDPEAPVHVVAGVLLSADRRLFVTQRPLTAHQGGKWELPGGKVGPGEAAVAALKRELHEEVGIDVLTAEPLAQVEHAYPDKRIRLDVWRVTRYRGTPHGREGQPARWANLADLDVWMFPEADRAILRKLQLPSLYLISDVQRFGKDAFMVRLERALTAGVRLLQLREPYMGRDEYRSYVCKVAALCHRYGAKLLINADPLWAADWGIDGVHLNSRRLMALHERPLASRYLVAASCHNEGELRQAEHINVDFIVLGPVRATPSHPDVTPLGWERFRALVASTPVPVYALGGMLPEHRGQAVAAGAQGLAMISGVWAADDLESVVAALTR